MRHARSNPRLLAILASIICAAASIASLAPAASATNAPLPGGGGSAPGTSHLVRIVLVNSGMSDWQVALLTTGTAVLGALAAVLAGRARTRRQLLLPAS